MANTTQIQVTAVDNEVYVIASTSAGSSELCHVKSGYNKPVSCTFDPGAILLPGTYDLTVVGINWSGPGVYAVSAPGTTPALVNPPSSNVVGVFHSQTVKMTITGP